MSNALSPNLNVMIKAAQKAGRSLRRDFGEVENLQVSTKGPGDFVSAADRRAEHIIHEELSYARPDYGFLMEESGVVEGKNNDYRWIIDPLDGTTNFLHGLPHWAVSIALEEKGEIVAGVIYDVIKDEMFHAEKNKGAFMQRRRLRVSGRNNFMESTIACGMPKRQVAAADQFNKEYQTILKLSPGIRRFGAAALDMAYVAAGRFEAFWERGIKAWDVAAGIILVKEAGGFVFDLDSDSKDPAFSGNIVAGNALIINDLKKLLRDIGPKS